MKRLFLASASARSSLFTSLSTHMSLNVVSTPQIFVRGCVWQVSPGVKTVGAGEVAEWRVQLAAPTHALASVPDVELLLRLLPVCAQG